MVKRKVQSINNAPIVFSRTCAVWTLVFGSIVYVCLMILVLKMHQHNTHNVSTPGSSSSGKEIQLDSSSLPGSISDHRFYNLAKNTATDPEREKSINNVEVPQDKLFEHFFNSSTIDSLVNKIEWVGPSQSKYINHSNETIRLLHIINPFPTSNLDSLETQQLSMATIHIAKQRFESLGGKYVNMAVDILPIEGPFLNQSDAEFVARPSSFLRNDQNIIHRSAFDIISNLLPSNTTKKGVPLLRDIFEIALNYSDRYTHIVYTNIDIAVMPHFYKAVYDTLSCDKISTFFFNRVEIPETIVIDPEHFSQGTSNITDIPINLQTLNIAYEYTRKFAQVHPGFDCLITSMDKLPAMIAKIGLVFTGFPPVGSHLVESAKYAESKCIVVKGLPVTFHVGTRNSDWDKEGNEKVTDINRALASFGSKMNDAQKYLKGEIQATKRRFKPLRCVTKSISSSSSVNKPICYDQSFLPVLTTRYSFPQDKKIRKPSKVSYENIKARLERMQVPNMPPHAHGDHLDHIHPVRGSMNLQMPDKFRTAQNHEI